jgi:hypothetical protein
MVGSSKRTAWITIFAAVQAVYVECDESITDFFNLVGFSVLPVIV